MLPVHMAAASSPQPEVNSQVPQPSVHWWTLICWESPGLDLTSGVPSGAHPAGKGQVVSGRAGRGAGLATAPSFLGCSCTLPCDSDTSPGSLAPLAASLCPWLTVWGLESLPHGRRAARGWVVPENPRTHSPCVQTPAICLPLPGPSWERGSPSGLRRGADRFDSHGSYLHARTLIHLPLMD